jgi:hypothetical protein
VKLVMKLGASAHRKPFAAGNRGRSRGNILPKILLLFFVLALWLAPHAAWAFNCTFTATINENSGANILFFGSSASGNAADACLDFGLIHTTSGSSAFGSWTSTPSGRGVDGNQPNDNQITYTPAMGAVGTDSFSIAADGDATNDSTLAVTITIAAVLPAPQPSSATVAANTTNNPIPLTINGGTATSLAISTQAAHGTATVSGTSITYTPTAGFSGVDSFQYTATDSAGTSAPATVTITVTLSPPSVSSVSPTSGSTAGGTSVNITGIGFTGATGVNFGPNPAAGFTVNSATSITATAPAAAAGQVDITVTNSAGTSATNANDKYTYVTPVVAGAVSATVAYDSSANNIALNLSGGAATSVAVATAASHGTATAAGTAITYTPATGYFGTDSLTYTGTNGAGTSAPATVSITVSAPTITVTPATLTAGTFGVAYSQSLTASGGQAPYSFSLASGALPAGLTLNSSGSITGTPTAAGTFTFTVSGTDSSTATHASFTSATISLTIDATVPGAPTIGTATAGNSQATVSFTAPASNGGATITGFTVTSTPSNITASGSASPITLTGLTNGTAYTFKVTATNSIGIGSASAASNSVTPVAAPPVAGTVSATVAYDSSANPITLNLSGGAPASVAVASVASHGTATATGAAITYTPATGFFGNDSFTYTATNAPGTSPAATVTITVSAPTITVTPTTLTAGSVGVSYNQSLTASGGQTPYSFALASGALPGGLLLNGNGSVTGTPTAVGTFTFTVSGTDSSTATHAAFTSATISLTVNATVPGAPTIGTATAGNAQATVSFTAPASNGGAAITGYTVTSTPSNITASGSASPITVTGLTNGTAYTFKVTVTNSIGTGSASAASNSVTPLAPPVAGAVSATVAYDSSANPITLNLSGGAPASVAVASVASHGTATATGTAITYTPTTGYFGPDSFTYTATNAAGTSPAATVTITVSAPTITVTPATLTSGTAGTAYNQSLTASGGQAPYSFSLASGALPAGLTLNSNGSVTGTPTAVGTFTFTVSGTDSSTATHAAFTSATISLTINSPTLALSPTSGTALTGTAETAYSQSFTASGGTPGPGYAYALTVNSGTMPTGLSFSTSTGVLSGTPVTPGTVNFAVRATDNSTGTGAPFTVTGTYTLTVAAPTVSLAPATLPAPSIGAPYSQAITASGGQAPYTFSVTGGSLPVGLALSNGGILSGTPTGSAATYNFTVTALDTHGFTASQAYSVTVGVATLTVAISSSSTSVPSGGDITYAIGLTVSGGSAGAVSVSDALPASLTFVSVSPPGGWTCTTPGVGSGGTVTCSVPSVAPGIHNLSIVTRVRPGTPPGPVVNNVSAGATGTTTQSGSTTTSVTPQATTTTSLASSVNPSALGQAVTFTATVTSPGGIPTGAVAFSDSGALIGTSPLTGGTATFSTTTLTAGSHVITATFSGGTSFAASTSTAINQTVGIPADSVKLRELQVAVTKVVAQNSGQAISGAIDSAISDGFGDGGALVTPSGTGFRFNFSADPDPPGNTNSNKVVSDRWNGTFGRNDGLSNGGANGYARREKPSRVDDAFAAIDRHTKAAKAPPLVTNEAKNWLLWADVRASGIDRWGTGAPGGVNQSLLYGSQFNALIGLTRRFTPALVAGVVGGYETFDYTSQDITGKLKGQGWTVGSYFGWRVAQSIRFDAAVAYSGIGYDGTAGTAQGNFDGRRWMLSSGLTGNYKMLGFDIEPSAKVYALWEHEDAYTDSLRTRQADRDFAAGRASGGLKLAYPFAWTDSFALAPYVGIYGDYYFTHDDAAAIADAGATPLASTLLLDGWSARATAGLAARFASGAAISVSGELGGIGSDIRIWTYRARAAVPF